MAGNLTRQRINKGFGQRRRQRENIDIATIPTYAIGDVHGCYDLLAALERKIYADGSQISGRKLIIMLGDVIDRGPASAQVVSRLMARPPGGFDRMCLTGNHEMAMLAYIDGEIALADWLALGGEATLNSYGLDIQHLTRQYPTQKKLDKFIRTWLPADHVEFLRSLPILIDTPKVLFVHAGIDPDRSIAAQTDEDLVYIRSRFIDSPQPLPKLIIHGHTPVGDVEAHGLRLNIDTGAYRSGKLSAVRLWNGRVQVIST